MTKMHSFLNSRNKHMSGPDREYRDQTEAQRQAEEQFRKLVEQALVGIYIFQDGFFPYMNPKAAEILGCSGRAIFYPSQ
jgi:PAS domain-containing protein